MSQEISYLFNPIYQEQQLKDMGLYVTGKGEMQSSIKRALSQNNCWVTVYEKGNEIHPAEHEQLLVVGPMAPINSLCDRLHQFGNMPVTIWDTEQSPHYPIPTFATQALVYLREKARRYLGHELPARRLGVIAELQSIQEHNNGDPKSVAVYSELNRAILAEFGITSQVILPGVFPELSVGNIYNKPQEDRQIDAVFIGSTKGNRRGKTIAKLQEEFRNLKISFKVIDGGNLGDESLFGEDRTKLLRNTKLMIASGRDISDDHIYRMFLAGANQMAVVVEGHDALTTNPFREGVDFVSADLAIMPVVVKGILASPTYTQRLVDNLTSFINQYPIEQQVRKLIR